MLEQQPIAEHKEVPIPREYSGQPIYLRSRTFVPLAGIDPALEVKPKFHAIVQLKRVPTEREREELGHLGAQLLAYLPENSWLASLSEERLPELAAHPLVYSVSPFLPDDKLAETLRQHAFSEWALDDEGNIFLIVVVHEDAFEESEAVLQRYGSIINAIELLHAFTVRIPLGYINELAKEDAVQWIEMVPPPPENKMDQARVRIDADRAQTAPYNLNGNGINAMLYESGAPFPHGDFSSRLTINTSCFRLNNDHATHTAGILIGDGTGNANFRGIATRANLTAYCLPIGAAIPPFNIPEMISDVRSALSLSNPVKVSSNSWGDPSSSCLLYGTYTAESRLFDQIVRGALGSRLPWVHANGNERGLCPLPRVHYNTTLSQATAKNVISVGSTDTDPGEIVSFFSSFGPTADGRIKPDVMAPGCESGGDHGITAPKNSSNEYSPSCGTSFATPQVAGTIVLMLEQHRRTYNREPPPSTYKAILIHTARDVDSAGPDFRTGYGIINTTGTIDTLIESNNKGTVIEQRLGNMQNHTFFSNVSAGGRFKATLVWDDREGTLNAGRQLVNNLDLVVFSPTGQRVYPWTLDPSNPAAGAVQTRDDNLNNVEQVTGTSATGGLWKVIVAGPNIPLGPQNYSLILSHNRFFSLVNAVLVIDRSGSMFGQKIADAKSGATLFVDLMAIPEGIGVVDFDNIITVTYPLTQIASNKEKDDAKAAIASLTARGSTNIGGGLRAALNEIVRFCNIALPSVLREQCPRAIVLLSDGQHNTGEDPRSVIPDLATHRVRVYTIGLGADVDQRLMSEIAQATGGAYRFAANSGALREIDADILDELRGRARMSRVREGVTQGSRIYTVNLDPALTQATFSLIWSGVGELNFSLIDPSLRLIKEATPYPDVRFTWLPGYKEFFVQPVQPGTWQINVSSTNVQMVNYTVLVSGNSGFQFHANTDRASYTVGDTIKMSASVSGPSAVLQNVSAIVTYPYGAVLSVLLYDDGTHGDPVPNDGVFTYHLPTQIGDEGSFTIQITGRGAVAGFPFVRVREFSVSVSPPVELSSCQTLTQQGGYELTTNVTVLSGSCFHIATANVTLDCRGHAILGTRNGTRVPFVGINAQTDRNVIKNCFVNGFDYGIRVSGYDYAISNSTVMNTRIGFYFMSFVSSNVTGNIALNNSVGFSGNSLRFSFLINNKVFNNGNGFALGTLSGYNLFEGNDIYGNGDGIRLVGNYISVNTIRSNIFRRNQVGINIDSAWNYFGQSQDVYNNIFNNTVNVLDVRSYPPGQENHWNTARTQGTNIIGGPFIGGNFWHDYQGVDVNGDGIGDTMLPYTSNGNIVSGGDYAPLVPLTTLSLSGTPAINSTVTFNLHAGWLLLSQYILAFSLGNVPGILLPDGRVLGLNPDPLLLLTLQAPQSIGLSNNVGYLNLLGQANVTWRIPDVEQLAGVTVYAAYVTINPFLPVPIPYISPTIPLKLLPPPSRGGDLGLVAYWRFDEGSGGFAYDSSGNGNHGTLTNGPMWIQGRVRTALKFDGVDDRVTIPDSDSLDIGGSDFSFAAWINRSSPPWSWPNAGILSKTLLNCRTGYFTGINFDPTGKIAFELYRSPGGCANAVGGQSRDFVPLNEWHHVAITFQRNGNATFYLDGNPAGAVDISQYTGDLSNDRPLLIGMSETYSNQFKGIIDEIRVYNRSLSAAEVYELYSRP